MIESPATQLNLLAKPPPAALADILDLGRVGRARLPTSVHVTLARFGDQAARPPRFLPRLRAALDGLQAAAFRVVFDRVEEGATVLLVGTEPMTGMLSFQARLQRQLARYDLCPLRPRPHPHVTLRYRPDGRGAAWIDPVSWRVEEVLLVESSYGPSPHRLHGRWRLAPAA